jgi:hypothetical protein
MATALGDETQSLRTVHSVFAGQVRAGEVDIEALLGTCRRADRARARAVGGLRADVVDARAEERPWLPLSTDLTVHLLDEARCEWILLVNRARHTSDGYASVDIQFWDVEDTAPRLVAYGTQVKFFTFPEV